MSWGLVRHLLTREGCADAALDNPCPHCGGPHGPVRITGAPWRASIAYAGGLAVVGIVPDAVTAFGLDAEPLIDPVREAAGGIDGGLLRWVRAEAVLKADGRGLRGDSPVDITESRAGWTARIAGDTGSFTGWEPEGPPGVLVSVAVRR